MKRRILLTLLCLSPLAAQASPAQEATQPQASPPPAAIPQPQEDVLRFPAQVEQVTVDVVVTDKKDNPVSGLKAEDFVLTEDGVPQSIASFDAVQVPAEASATPPPRLPVSTNTSPENRTGRTFAILFDDIHLTQYEAYRAKTAVATFMQNGVREGDRVSLVSSSGTAWWSARMEAGRAELMALLKRLDGRLVPDTSPDKVSEWEAMRIQTFNDPDVSARVARRFENYGVAPQSQRGGSDLRASATSDPLVRARASEVYFQSVARNRITLGVLERMLNSLISTKGRKSVVLVSEGFIYDTNMDEFKRVTQASRRASAAVYFLDASGLGGLPDSFSAEFGAPIDQRDVGSALLDNTLRSEGSEAIASDSGGFTVKNTNDLTRGIQRIADESRSYYLLGYNPTNTAADGRFRKIAVKTSQKGVQIRARKGYYAPLEGKAPPPPKPGDADPDIQRALDSPYDVAQLPLRMTAYIFDETILGKATSAVTTEVDVHDFAFQEQEGRLYDAVEFLLVVAHRETGEYFRYDQKIEMKLQPATRDRLARYWFPIVRDFELAPGGYQAKIVVRERNTGRIGTVTHNFEVPELTQFRASTLLLSDTLQPTAEGESKSTPRPAMLARREFPSGATLWGDFQVFGAEKDKQTGMPRVAAGYLIRGGDGVVHTRVESTPIKPTSLGKLSRLVGTSLEGFAPGDYEFVLNLKDEIAGKTLEIRELFSVGPADTASASSR